MRTFQGLLKVLPENGIYVFFSSIEGYHTKGTSKIAYENFDAIWGKAFHSMGRSFGICIKFKLTPRIEESFMRTQIDNLYHIARRDKDKLFYIMYNGINTIGNYTPNDLVRVFKSKEIPDNLVFEEEFSKLLLGTKKIINEEEV